MELENIAEIVRDHLVEIQKLYKPGVELTFFMRNPKEKDSHMIISNDNLLEVAQCIKESAEGTPEGHAEFKTTTRIGG